MRTACDWFESQNALRFTAAAFLKETNSFFIFFKGTTIYW